MKALLIEFNKHTGKRAGNINPRSKDYFCFGHQNLDVSPALEIRVVKNEEVEEFEGVEGITVLHDDVEIDAAIDTYMESSYKMDEFIAGKDMDDRNIKMKDLPGNSKKEITKNLKDLGVKGIVERKHLKTKDMK